MNIITWNQLSHSEQEKILMRPSIVNADEIGGAVSSIIQKVQNEGDRALFELTERFDKASVTDLKISQKEIDDASGRVSNEIKEAIDIAISNIQKFHESQKRSAVEVETMEGVYCQQVTRPIERVGLYIPGGTAPLLSTVMMLAIPAKIAGCRQIVLCSPPVIADEILYLAKLFDIKDVFQIGGAQAIAAMAFGTESVPKVDKIFGPGNAYVTEAKQQVSQKAGGAAMDMPAGPSEVMVVADKTANPRFIAADLLSQAEHGIDSQVVLVTPDANLAAQVSQEIDGQLQTLPRADIARQALNESRLIVTNTLEECVDIANYYGAEHLIIQTQNADEILFQINSAGSVFLGNWSPESAGDYASGTNHVLPTYGYTATYSSLGLDDFQKRMTVQKLTKEGLLNIGRTVEILATSEQLIAHKQAVSIRLEAIKNGEM